MAEVIKNNTIYSVNTEEEWYDFINVAELQGFSWNGVFPAIKTYELLEKNYPNKKKALRIRDNKITAATLNYYQKEYPKYKFKEWKVSTENDVLCKTIIYVTNKKEFNELIKYAKQFEYKWSSGYLLNNWNPGLLEYNMSLIFHPDHTVTYAYYACSIIDFKFYSWEEFKTTFKIAEQKIEENNAHTDAARIDILTNAVDAIAEYLHATVCGECSQYCIETHSCDEQGCATKAMLEYVNKALKEVRSK